VLTYSGRERTGRGHYQESMSIDDARLYCCFRQQRRRNPLGTKTRPFCKKGDQSAGPQRRLVTPQLLQLRVAVLTLTRCAAGCLGLYHATSR
jgi:hypothetical protein